MHSICTELKKHKYNDLLEQVEHHIYNKQVEHILFFEKEPHLIKVFLLFLWAALKATSLKFSIWYYQTSSNPLIITKLILIHIRFI